MNCDAVREALSASLDDEPADLDARQIRLHLEECSPCAAWSFEVNRVHEEVRSSLAAAPPVADLTPAILAAIGRAEVVSPESANRSVQPAVKACRILLACCALLQLVVTLPILLGGTGPVHLDHELGAWDLSLAAGLLFAAVRPERAWGMLPLVAAIAVALGVTAIVDVTSGHATLASESGHLMEAIGLFLLWHLARFHRASSSHTHSPNQPQGVLYS